MKNKIEFTYAIGLRIKTIRKNRQWSQDDLADACGVSKETLSKIERGLGDPRASTLKIIAKAFGIDVGELVSDKAIVPFGRARNYNQLVEKTKNMDDKAVNTLLAIIDCMKL